MYPVFAVPSASHSICVEFFRSYIASSQILQRAGITHTCVQVNGDYYLSHARNRLVHLFLTDYPDATDLFFLDDDLGWEAEAIPRLLQDPVDVVAGVYPKKQDKLEFPVVMDQADGHTIRGHGGLFRALRVSTGFLRIRRHVLERMAAQSPIYEVATPDGGRATIAEVFTMGVKDGLWWGEDFAWCNKWREMGGEIWIDPCIEFTHSGRKQWKGRLMDSAVPVEMTTSSAA
jgi:hypothetical protein